MDGMLSLVIGASVAAALFGTAWGVQLAGRWTQRWRDGVVGLDRAATPAMLSPALKIFWRMSWPLVPLAMPWVRRWPSKALTQTLADAGFYADNALLRFRAMQLATALLGGMTCLVLTQAAGLNPGVWGLAACGVLSGFFPQSWLRDHLLRRKQRLLKQFPFFLDLLALVIEAGATPTSGMAAAAERLPAGPLKEELARMLADVRLGRPRAEALNGFAARCDDPATAQFVTAMVAAERQGLSLGPVLRAQALQRRSERFQRAEKAAMQAPVRMLGPLIICIFPCTFAILLFPVISRILGSGMFGG